MGQLAASKPLICNVLLDSHARTYTVPMVHRYLRGAFGTERQLTVYRSRSSYFRYWSRAHHTGAYPFEEPTESLKMTFEECVRALRACVRCLRACVRESARCSVVHLDLPARGRPYPTPTPPLLAPRSTRTTTPSLSPPPGLLMLLPVSALPVSATPTAAPTSTIATAAPPLRQARQVLVSLQCKTCTPTHRYRHAYTRIDTHVHTHTHTTTGQVPAARGGGVS